MASIIFVYVVMVVVVVMVVGWVIIVLPTYGEGVRVVMVLSTYCIFFVLNYNSFLYSTWNEQALWKGPQ